MSELRHYDYIVVGAGVDGSSTAYQLAKQGHTTLLLEQFPLPHNRGSSHGQSRITRKSYGRDAFFTRMMIKSYKLLEELEEESGQKLYVKSGTLVISREGNPYGSDTVTCLKENGIPFEQFTSQTIKGKYPMMSFPPDYSFVLEHSGGVLKADKILAAYHDQFRRYGGTLIDGEGMVSLTPGRPVKVHTTRNTYTANGLVLACGPWSKSLLTGLDVHVPLKIMRINVCYWKERRPGSHSATNFPTFLCCTSKEASFSMYGLPSYEYPGLVKICYHSGPEIDPNGRDMADGSPSLEHAQSFVREHFPGLEPEPSIVESCIYSFIKYVPRLLETTCGHLTTMTPDEYFCLDRLPSNDNIVIAAGFSGHGFKLAPVVGLVLSQFVAGKPTDFPMEPFRMDRFKSRKDNSKL